MSELGVFIKDGGGSKRRAPFDTTGGLVVTPTSYPACDDKEVVAIYREYLKESGGSSDMRADGSSTPVEFSVSAHPDYDIYVSTVSFLISDAGAVLNEFGNLPALTNGCDFFYSSAAGEVTIAEGLKTHFEFIRLCAGQPSFGNGASAFKANNMSGISEGYMPVFSFSVFGMPWGARLQAGSVQSLVLRINDDVSTLDAFDAIAYGFTRKRGFE